MTGNKRAARITADDVMDGACALLSLFIPNPQFQGQTKEKLTSPEAAKLVENMLKDHVDHWLSGDPETANVLLARVIEHAEERASRRKAREFSRKSATRTVRLPGKPPDCSRANAGGTQHRIVRA